MLNVKSEVLLEPLLSIVQAIYSIADQTHIPCFILCVAQGAHCARIVVHGDEAALDGDNFLWRQFSHHRVGSIPIVRCQAHAGSRHETVGDAWVCGR